MTTSYRRFSLVPIMVALCTVLALCVVPARALALSGTGSQTDPLVVTSFDELKTALESEENAYIRVSSSISKNGAMTFDSSGTWATIPEGYVKDLDLQATVQYTASDTDEQFATFIRNQGTFYIHGNSDGRLSVTSKLDGMIALIRNEGTLYVYDSVQLSAYDKGDGNRHACAIHCASDDAKLVISGATSKDAYGNFLDTKCVISGSAEQDLTAGIGGGVYVEKAAAVHVFGGELMAFKGGSSGHNYNGLVVNADWDTAKNVYLHGGTIAGVTFIGEQAYSRKATQLTNYGVVDEFVGEGEGYFDDASHYHDGTMSGGVKFRRTDGARLKLVMKPVNTDLMWTYLNTMELTGFTAADGITYTLAYTDEDGVTVPSACLAKEYPGKDRTVVMASEPVWPVLYRPNASDESFSCVGLPVTAIYDRAFMLLDGASEVNITSIEIADSVRDINAAAFYGTALTTVVIPEAVTTIEESAFEDSSLASVTIEGNNFKNIGEGAFAGSHLKEITCMSTSNMNIAEHAYGYYVDGEEGDYVPVDSLYVYATPDTPFWEDAVKKGFIADLRTATVKTIPDQAYTGSAIKPKPEVTVTNDRGTVTLKEGVDYKLSYKDNVKAGSAVVGITAINPPNYGSTTASFAIVKAPISGATVEAIPDQDYTGKKIEPKVTATLGSTSLEEGVDFEVSYKDNVEIGTATATLTGKGDYTGTKDVKFKIVEPSPDPTPGVTAWKRLAGDNALETMAAIVEEGSFPVGGTVVLASLEGYWDALTAAGIAGLESAPVLMVLPDAVPERTAVLLDKLAPKKIVVCGGTYWIPDKVVEQATVAAGGSPEVVRLAGDNAAQTAEKIAAEGKGTWDNTAIVATAGTFQDALAAAPVAYAKKMPIFLAQFDFAAEKGSITADTVKAMKDAGIEKCYIAGGTYWLPQSVTDDLKAAGIEVLGQLGGATAVETSGLIAQLAVTELGMKADNMGVADVRAHYDALASAALCGKNGSVLVLALNEKSSVIDGFVKDSKSAMAKAYIFGGTSSVSTATEEALKVATK